MRSPYNYAMFSGNISATYPPNTDILGNKKLTFYISTKSNSKEGGRTVKGITSYNLDIQHLHYFKKGCYVYLICNIMDIKEWYMLLSISNNSYDCNKQFMEQIYEEAKYEEEPYIEPEPKSKIIKIKRLYGKA